MATTTRASRWPRWLLAGLWSVCGVPAAHAAAEPQALVLEHLTTSDGLPQGTVYATLQDSQGFVWLATEDGLVRYDGHALFRYGYARSDASGLPGNFVGAIAEDAHHDIWVAAKGGGLARWNRAADRFTVYRHNPANPASLVSDGVRRLLIDSHGRIWAGTSGAGVDVLDPATGQISHHR